MLAPLPLAATLVLLVWATPGGRMAGAEQPAGQLADGVGFGPGAALPSYLIGLLVVLALVYGFGLLVETGLQRGLDSVIQAMMRRIPVVRTVYDIAHRLVGLFSKPKDEGVVDAPRCGCILAARSPRASLPIQRWCWVC